MKYYSKLTFLFLIIINTTATLLALLSLAWSYSWVGSWNLLMFNSEGLLFNLFAYIIPLPFLILSTFIILLQQKGYKHFGYLMIVLAAISSWYFIYMQTTWSFWSKIVDFLSETPLVVVVFELIFLVVALIPFYVLVRLVGEDLSKKH